MKYAAMYGPCLVLLLAALVGLSVASIDQSPQRASPEYIIDLDSDSASSTAAPSTSTTEKPQANEVEGADAPLPVRRVILMPAFSRTYISSSGDDDSETGSAAEWPMMRRPSSLLPLLFPQHFMRDFNRNPFAGFRDQMEPLSSSSSVSSLPSASNPEREDSAPTNPIDLLLDMMTKALRQHSINGPSTAADSESSPASGVPAAADKGVTETQEEVVTINGRKYLKKSVVTRNTGDHLMFITRRLVFTPLDELEGTPNATTTTTTTEAPSSRAADNAEAPAKSTTTTTVEPASKQSTEASTRVTEETTTAAAAAKPAEPTSRPEKMVEPTPVAASEKPTAESTGDKPVPSSEPDFVRT